jgi:hypothetical protein
MIFTLPEHLRHPSLPNNLAYIEWFGFHPFVIHIRIRASFALLVHRATIYLSQRSFPSILLFHLVIVFLDLVRSFILQSGVVIMCWRSVNLFS